MGHKALVTGGTRGIGLAIAQRLAQDGLEVMITGTHPGAKTPYRFFSVDFSDRSATEAFAQEIQAVEVDILVNNAGINRISPFGEINTEDFDRIHEVNVRTPLLLCQAVLPHMKKAKWGRIVNISSIFGLITRPERASYSASKFALDGLTRALAVEVAAEGILANCIAPGFIDTELTRSVLGEVGMRDLAKQVPIRRMGKPEEIAELVAWLASPRNTFLTGQNIAIDGGFTSV